MINSKVKLQDCFFAPRQDKMETVTIESSLKKCKETGRLDAFKLQQPGGDIPVPHVYWDSDVAKVMEGMAHAVRLNPESPLRKRLDELVDLVVSAQQPDGYLNTHYTVVEQENRWKALHWAHELYCCGHLTEAAVAHWEATGSTKFLDAMSRYADYVASVFGHGEGQIAGYPGHEELELALVKLYRATKNRKYLELSKYFVDERGQSPNYFSEKEGFWEGNLSNLQAHKPVREQDEAVGHAVRATYLYSGMADVAMETADKELFSVCEKLFDNIADKKMYLTGGIGSTRHGEAFRDAYVLPNADAYAESCASIGMVFFASRMLRATGDSKYADVMEREMYNGAISGLSLKGDEFFYVNPLEVSSVFSTTGHILPVRQEWFGCSCCPTSYCRFLPQLQDFCFFADDDALRINIPASATIQTSGYTAEITGDYPYSGKVTMQISSNKEIKLFVRIMDFCNGKFTVKLNGQILVPAVEKGYAVFLRKWNEGDVLEWDFPMEPNLVYANSHVSADAGCAAVTRGPLVYTFETTDNPGCIRNYALAENTPEFTLKPVDGLLPGTIAIECNGFVREDGENAPLYSTKKPLYQTVRLTAIPYALWQNRGSAEMKVFLPLK